MYTGYFAKYKQYIEQGLIPISISRKTPHWFNGDKYIILAPKYMLIYDYKNGTINEEVYKERFNKWLNCLIVEHVVEELSSFGDLDKLVLCCYERPTDFCHRHLVADWLNKYTDLDVKEYIC